MAKQQASMCFPISKDPGGYWQPRNRQQSIRASFEMILGTIPGERLHLPEFGSRLEELELEPNDEILEALAKEYTVEAVLRWENRVRLIGVEVVQDEHTARVLSRFVDIDDPNETEQIFVKEIRRG